MSLPRRRGRHRDDSARELLDRAVTILRQRQRNGVTVIAVAEMLALLGADPETAPAPLAQFHDPHVDPITGCRSALPD